MMRFLEPIVICIAKERKFARKKAKVASMEMWIVGHFSTFL